MRAVSIFVVLALVMGVTVSAHAGLTKADKIRLEQLEARSGDSKQAMDAYTQEIERLGIRTEAPPPPRPSAVDLINESFEGTFPPTGWTSVIVTGDSAWRYSTSVPHSGTGNAYSRYNPAASPAGSKFLTTKRVTVAGASSYTLSFWIRRVFSSAFPPDTVYVKISTTDSLPGSFGTTLYKCYTGDNASVDPNIYTTTYKQFSTIVSGYSGDVFIAFDHQDDDGQTLYLDDVILTENLTNDMAAFSLDDPANGGSKTPGATFSPMATFKNTGSTTQSGVTVRYQILNTVPAVVYTNDQTTGSLIAGATEQKTFASVAGGLAAGSYTIRAISLLGGDGNSSNDTVSGTITVAPNIADYTFFASSGTFTPLSSPTVPVLSGGNLDDGWYNDIPIGFDFTYNAVTYTDLAASTNGWLALGQSSVTTSALTNDLDLGATTIGVGGTNARPILAALWDDLEIDTVGGAGGQFSYKTEQVAGPSEGIDSVFTAEWLLNKWTFSAAAGNISFQVKLYKSGRVEFIYQQEAGAFTSGGAGIGITDNNTGTNHFISLDGTGSSPARSSSTEYNITGPRPATGQMYTFGPPVADDVAPFSFDVPTNGGSVSSGVAFSPQATFKNVGTANQGSAFNVKYEIINSVPTVVYTNTQSIASLAAGATQPVTFASVAGGLAAGNYTIRAITLLGTDANTANDTSTGSLTVLPSGTFFYEPFATFPPAGWARTGTVIWKGGTAIQSDGISGGTAFADFFSVSSGTDTLKSPIIDLSAFAPGALPKVLKFDHAYRTYTGGESDTVRLIVSSDGGVTWGATLFDDGAPTMATLPPSATELIPASASDWKSNIFGVPAPYLVSGFRMAFVAKTDFGNNFYLDNVYVTALPDTDLVMESLTQPNGVPDPFRPAQGFTGRKTAGLAMDMHKAKGYASPGVNRSRMLPDAGHNADGRLKASVNNSPEANVPVTVRSVIRNYGGDSPSYTVDWSFDGVSQTPVARGGFATFGADSVDLSLTPSDRGTFSTNATATVSNDANTGNNAKLFLRTLVYPDSSIRIKYDNGSNIADNSIGYSGPDVEAGVRFTATQDIKLANIDAYYNNASGADSITVKVYAAGANDTTPGSLLYTKNFGGPNYTSTSGDYFTLPLGNDAPTFASGSDFWVSILFPPTAFPMGVHSTGFTAGRSFISADSGATWSALIIDPDEFAWLMRVVGFNAGSSVSVGVDVATGWNLISNPVENAVPDDSVKHLYPASLFNYAFSFGPGGYAQSQTMTVGKGYWGKFGSSTTQTINGLANTYETVPVNAGWNLVGSLSVSIDTGQVDDPGAIRSSVWFGYSGTYFTATTIDSGKAYWVKASTAGNFIFSTAPEPAGRPAGVNVLDALSTITITDKNGAAQTLYFGSDQHAVNTAMYAMPPMPPVGAFDARFETAEGGTMVQTHASGVAVSIPIALQAYEPVTVSWTIADGAVYELSSVSGGQPKLMQGSGSTTLGNTSKMFVKFTGLDGLPKEYALYQNYPNPFNPSTNIRFALPVQSRVTAEIYNTLGQRVKSLVNDQLSAGYHIVEWNGTGNSNQTLGSGVYFIRLSAIGTEGKSFTDVRKLMLVK